MPRRGAESKFVYPRSITRDLSRVLADLRARCWCDPQLQILDQLIGDLQDMFSEHDPGTTEASLHEFADWCQRWHGRAQELNNNTDTRRYQT